MAEKSTNGKVTKTIHGLEMELNPNVFDDVDNFDLIEDLKDGKIRPVKAIIEQILGDEQYRKVRDYFRSTEGKFSTNIALEIINAVQEIVGPKE